MSHHSAALLGVLLLLAGDALAIDGVVEINMARALAGGVTAADTPGFPVTLSVPGSYRLTGSLTVTDGHGIEATVDDVTLDLNGFKISCGPGCTTGNGVKGLDGLRVSNGSVRKMPESGIFALHRARIHNVDASSNGLHGIATGESSIVTGCVAEDNAADGIRTGSAVLIGNASVSNGDSGLLTVWGVAAGNVANANGTSGAPQQGNGFEIAGGVVHGNVSRQNALHGVRIQQNNAIVGNTLVDNLGIGILSDGFGNSGYAENTFEDNAGTVNCSGGCVIEIGTNVCNGNTSCP